MELQDYVRIVRKRVLTISVVVLLVLALGSALTLATTKVYMAQTEFFVSTSGSDNATALQQGNTFTQARVKSYSQLLESPKVLDPVIASLHLKTTAAELANQVTATVPVDTVIIDVAVTDRNAAQAARIAEAIDTTFPATIQEIESVQGQPSPVKVTVVQSAEASDTPVSPKPARNLALALVLGLIAGFGVALLRDILDTTIKSKRDATDVTDKTIIGSIAFDSGAPEHPLIVQADPRSPRAEAFRSLRTNLQFIEVAHPPKSIVVTSSVAGEGKSTTAANLAISLAEAGLKVCVLEGDLRRPRLLDYLGFEGSVGVTDVLIGRVPLDEALQPFGTTGLSVLGAGPLPPNPSELLGSSTMAALIKELEGRFDYLIIDAPPLLPVTDAAVVSTIVDGAVVVVGAGIVHKDQLGHAIASLDAVNGNILGLVLNRLQPKDQSAGYSGYSYGYAADETGRTVKRPWSTKKDASLVRPKALI